jgi:hypothetical protein
MRVEETPEGNLGRVLEKSTEEGKDSSAISAICNIEIK